MSHYKLILQTQTPRSNFDGRIKLVPLATGGGGEIKTVTDVCVDKFYGWIWHYVFSSTSEPIPPYSGYVDMADVEAILPIYSTWFAAWDADVAATATIPYNPIPVDVFNRKITYLHIRPVYTLCPAADLEDPLQARGVTMGWPLGTQWSHTAKTKWDGPKKFRESDLILLVFAPSVADVGETVTIQPVLDYGSQFYVKPPELPPAEDWGFPLTLTVV